MNPRQAAQRFVKYGFHEEGDQNFVELFLAKEILRAEVCWPSLTENSNFALAVAVAHELGVKCP